MSGPEIKGCPFCGGQPIPSHEKVHNCGEPYRVVRLSCKQCGVSMSAVASDAESDEGWKLAAARGVPGGEGVAHVVVRDRLLPRWNTRASTPHKCKGCGSTVVGVHNGDCTTRPNE